jgi:alkylation response protein AidB-like acyl-CoA dehydrogenase
LGWPREHGGHGATLAQQVIFYEEYARSRAPARVGYLGEELLGPTLIAFGTPAQQRRFLEPIRTVKELWCQGYSEPGAGSDLAAVSTAARLDGDRWVVTGQKVWTSLAVEADWCFVLARTEPGSRRSEPVLPAGPDAPEGVTVRPIRQLTGTSEFNEVFFDDARTHASLVVGEPGNGWRVARATLAFERGAATLGQQIGFERELRRLAKVARQTGAAADPRGHDLRRVRRDPAHDHRRADARPAPPGPRVVPAEPPAGSVPLGHRDDRGSAHGRSHATARRAGCRRHRDRGAAGGRADRGARDRRRGEHRCVAG